MTGNLKTAEQQVGCHWRYDESDYFWSSECGEDWQFTDGGPEENRVKFCQGCGRRVILPQATNPQTENDGWIEWGGGDRPVSEKAKVEVKHRASSCVSPVSEAINFDWTYYSVPFDTDIIAYRVIENDGRKG